MQGSLVTATRVDGRTIFRPTPGTILVYAGGVPDGTVESTIRTTSSGAFEVLLSPRTYFFGGRADRTGASCSSAGPFEVGKSQARVTVRCPTH